MQLWCMPFVTWMNHEFIVYFTRNFGQKNPKLAFANLTNHSFSTNQFQQAQFDLVLLG
jgi:hypothetical protein